MRSRTGACAFPARIWRSKDLWPSVEGNFNKADHWHAHYFQDRSTSFSLPLASSSNFQHSQNAHRQTDLVDAVLIEVLGEAHKINEHNTEYTTIVSNDSMIYRWQMCSPPTQNLPVLSVQNFVRSHHWKRFSKFIQMEKLRSLLSQGADYPMV